ncbi:early transcribed membrane protein, putative [Plasmodium knowlesi strain H]|uniref:Early transcribed membrane protein, putative n=3 Tax=Plasmodium knowlesi TaxID=5850 RepID=A0A5K1URE5_PLAKH|nr:early transcribed membrane protein 13 [Plasmodium knowlesi strain H]OTN63994.1 putative Early transcribed membrane protein [Plasmodium knowlesi]CAA9990623.1 early transcribed membrane protein 13 [Plasmodium knowlesi strain H]SBO26038.1 early transcribed membrane protein, putative [Plasmodium knowlesi strain H]SBO28735.1 early transcribed membrane protein, putative [Plasmodium knowlesi strain H]VVS80097.1 early transcribed membrane protein 13 [Plasmodium knowlesi strain H]|eukprot:XP_002261915.1 early transcribed membrane protein, putative [Plasmodium knowlesi strain H]
MNISKMLTFFFLLCASEKLFIVCASRILSSIEKDLAPLQNIDDILAAKDRKKKIYYSLISSGIFVAVAIALGIGYYINEKGKQDNFEKYTLFKDKRFQFEEPRDGQVPSTSREYVEPAGINKVNIKGALIENTNENDVPIKKFNIFLDNARIAMQHHFSNLSGPQQAYYVNDRDYIRMVVQSLEERRNVQLSRVQEDLAVLNMEHFLQNISKE